MTISPDQWTTFIEALRNGAVQLLHFIDVDFSALDSDVLLLAVGCRGLQSIRIHGSIVPSGFVLDDLIRSSVANGLRQLWFFESRSDAPHGLSENATVDFIFRANTAQRRQQDPILLMLEGPQVTETFLTKFFK
ncbi:hypothetical protein AAVH_42419, partial [Aphelenchoides avenae]